MQILRRLVSSITRIWVVLVSAATATLVACSVAPAEAQVIEESFATTGPSRLVVTIDNGGVEVTSTNSEGDTIQVTATVRDPDRVDYRTEQDGDTVRIIAKSDDGSSLLGNGDRGVDLVVSVPPEIDLELETSNGAIVVTGITGMISAKTSNGRVAITDANGDVEIETSNGRVELASVTGQVEVQTSNGPISYTGTLRPGSENKLQTSNGSVAVSLVDTAGVEITAATSNGRVSSSLPITVEGEVKENELKGTIGDGGSTLDIQASNGSINIK